MNKKIGKYLMKLSGESFFGILPRAHELRSYIYKKALHQKYNFSVHHRVLIHAHHRAPIDFKKINVKGLIVGKNCLFNDDVSIDLTGNVLLGDNVAFAKGALVYTHTHKGLRGLGKKVLEPNTLTIEDFVKIGAGAMILSPCTKIGRFAQIGAGAVVRSSIPPYSMVIGNPAKIIGFLYSPEEMAEFERSHYQEEDRTPLDDYTKMYEKYYKKRVVEISKILKL